MTNKTKRPVRVMWSIVDMFHDVDVATFLEEDDAIEHTRTENAATGTSGPRFQVSRSLLINGQVV